MKYIAILLLFVCFNLNAQLYEDVSDLIQTNLPDNSTQHITAARLRAVMDLAVQDVGAAQVYGPVATTYDPGAPQNPVSYFTYQGIYDNFLDSGDSPCEISEAIGILQWNGTYWTAFDIAIPEGTGGNSNVYFTDTTICVIGVDTTCVELDSFYIDEPNICFIDNGDTTCFSNSLSGAVPISSLAPAEAANTIDNLNYQQYWKWSTLSSNAGLKLEAANTIGGGTKNLLQLDMSGATSSLAKTLRISNICSGSQNYGVHSTATGGTINYGVFGSTTTGSSSYGVYGSATSGTGIQAHAETSGLPFRADILVSGTNAVDVLADLRKGTDGTPAAGLGGSLTFTTMATGPNYATSNTLTSKWLDATYISRKSQFLLSGVRSGTDVMLGTFSGDSITLDTTTFHIDVLNNRIGVKVPSPARTLDVRGLMNLKQSSTLSNVFINGGLTTASGDNNVVIGNSTAGDALTSGASNVIFGNQAGSAVTTGSNNVFIGSQSGIFLNDESFNIAIGYVAGQGSGGDTSICIGPLSGGGTDMDGSVLIGYDAGDPSVGGAYKRNTMLGHSAGAQYTGGSGNVFIGYKAGAGQSTGNDKLIIDNSSTTTPLLKGDFSADSLRINGDLAVKNRFKTSQGADVASASPLVLGSDGNVFEITGTTTLDLISKTGWFNGNEITLMFSSSLTITDGTANSGSNIGIELDGNTDMAAVDGAILKLILAEKGGTQRWREVSRSFN